MRLVLNVAEKPSVAKEVARLLSQNTAQYTRTWCAALLPVAWAHTSRGVPEPAAAHCMTGQLFLQLMYNGR